MQIASGTSFTSLSSTSFCGTLNLLLNVDNDPLNLIVFTIKSNGDFFEKHREVQVIRMNNGLCNDPDIDKWNLCPFSLLKVLIVGTSCLHFVGQLELVGFSELERIEIGSNSFMAEENCAFVVKDCPSLLCVSIGDDCFVHCKRTVFESEYYGLESRIDLPHLSSVSLGDNVFRGDEFKNNVLIMQSS